MHFITGIFEKLQSHPKRVVFPEGYNPRVIQAARQFFSLKLGIPILLGSRPRVKEIAAQLGIGLEGVRVIDPIRSDDMDTFARRFELLRRSRGLGSLEAREAMLQPNFFATMMLAMHQADALVSGADDSNGAVLRPLMQIIHSAPGTQTVCGCQIVSLGDTDNQKIGANGVLLLADCDVHRDPTVAQLADIALMTARLAIQLLNVSPRVALLSMSTRSKNTSNHSSREHAAAELACQRARNEGIQAYFDGELQADAAIVMDIAKRKLGEDIGEVAGRANVLVFPNLESASISSRLIQHLARTSVYGDILLGIDRPAAELSRGATSHDILGVAAILGEQCNQYRKMFPGAGVRIPGE